MLNEANTLFDTYYVSFSHHNRLLAPHINVPKILAHSSMISLKTTEDDFIWSKFFVSEVTHSWYLPAHCKRPYKPSVMTVDRQPDRHSHCIQSTALSIPWPARSINGKADGCNHWLDAGVLNEAVDWWRYAKTLYVYVRAFSWNTNRTRKITPLFLYCLTPQ
jgi:hypothetical protein